jgi:hypothetical protein
VGTTITAGSADGSLVPDPGCWVFGKAVGIEVETGLCWVGRITAGEGVERSGERKGRDEREETGYTNQAHNKAKNTSAEKNNQTSNAGYPAFLRHDPSYEMF